MAGTFRTKRALALSSVGVLLIAAIATIAVSWHDKDWWRIESFGCPQGFYRVNGVVQGQLGACGGLGGEGRSVTVQVGSTIDIHLKPPYGRVVSANPHVVREVGAGLFSSSQRFRAIATGKALLTTSKKPDAMFPSCAEISPVASWVPKNQLHGKNCSVLLVTVSSPS